MSQFYRRAGRILREFDKKNGSLKSLVFSSRSMDLRMKKKTYAILCQTIKCKKNLDEIIKTCKLMENKDVLSKSYHLCLILVFDVLYGKGLRCGGVLKSAISRHINKLRHAKESIGSLMDTSLHTDSLILPKYARLNTLKASAEEILERIEEEGFSARNHSEILKCTCFTNNHRKDSRMKCCFSQDALIPNLLMFCHCTPLTESRAYSESWIILQDKASCLPAHILSPERRSHVIDACAAPGNKTTHLASIMDNTGLVYAFDKDPKRYETLKEMVMKSGATNVVTQLSDFLEVDPTMYDDVNYILVDPSCSGSGIYKRLNYDSERPRDVKRLDELSRFQCRILNHALNFPSVQKVVYSTCSIHKEENEYVIRNVLLKNMSKFELVHLLPCWPSRGLPVFTKAHCCIRASADDKTNGFFVAMFRRRNK